MIVIVKITPIPRHSLILRDYLEFMKIKYQLSPDNSSVFTILTPYQIDNLSQRDYVKEITTEMRIRPVVHRNDLSKALRQRQLHK